MNKAKFYLYRNLHSKTFSIQHKGLVIARPLDVVMHDVSFSISEKGRQRVLFEKQKNVHAKVVAKSYEIIDSIDEKDLVEIYYNPYKTPFFINTQTNEPIHYVDKVYAKNGNKIYIKRKT